MSLKMLQTLTHLRSDFVEVFAGATTFERELVSAHTLPMLIETTRSLGAPQITTRLETGLQQLNSGTLSPDQQSVLLVDLGTSVLNTAKRFWKSPVCTSCIASR